MFNFCSTRVLQGVLALVLVGASSSLFASPLEKTVHVYKDGETLSSIAHRYHIPLQKLIDANDIKNPNAIRNHTKIVLPAPKKSTSSRSSSELADLSRSSRKTKSHSLHVEESLHRRASIQGDQVSVRVGPDSERGLVTRLDAGEQVVLTAKKSEWGQVVLGSGQSGWVRLDFLKLSPSKTPPAKENGESARLSAKREAKAKLEKSRAEQAAHEKRLAQIQKKAEVLKLAKKAEAKRRAEKLTKAARRKAAIPTEEEGTAAEKTVSRETPNRSDLVRQGLSYRGTPYRWGGAGRGGFDCSGFTSYLYAQKGISLPHSARSQFTYGHAVSRDALKEGDLVFFHTVTPGISHVGMYIGGGQFVHASSRRSGGVRTDTLTSGYYSQRLVGARRISR